MTYIPQSEEEREFLKSYDPSGYPRIEVTVDAVVLWWNTQAIHEDQHHWDVLLVKRGGHPYKDEWALPGGFIGQQESTMEAAIRELREETGVDLHKLHVDDKFALPARDKVGRDPRARIISIPWVFTVAELTRPGTKSDDDASDVKWEDERHVLDLAFDHEETLVQAVLVLDGHFNLR